MKDCTLIGQLVKVTTPEVFLLEDYPNKDYQETIEKVMTQYNDLVNFQIEKLVRDNVLPKLKGKITSGKLKWRGVKICNTSFGWGTRNETWIEQRGKRVSPVLVQPFVNNTDINESLFYIREE